MKYIEPYKIVKISNKSLVDAEQVEDVAFNKIIIANTGAQPLYFKEKEIDGIAATTSNTMIVPANTVFPVILTCSDLSLISNATGTSVAIMYLDM
jgi:hypothetical protein